MLNEPSFCDLVVTTRPVLIFRASTVAPTTTAFDWSATAPLIDPSVCCARAARGAISVSTQTDSINRPKLIFMVLPQKCFMQVVLASTTTSARRQDAKTKIPSSFPHIFYTSALCPNSQSVEIWQPDFTAVSPPLYSSMNSVTLGPFRGAPEPRSMPRHAV